MCPLPDKPCQLPAALQLQAGELTDVLPTINLPPGNKGGDLPGRRVFDMSRQGHFSVFIAALTSLAVHATAAVYLEHYQPPKPSAPPSSAPTLLLSLAPARPAAPQAIPRPEPVPQPESRPPPKPPPRPVPVAKPKPRPKPPARKPPATTVTKTSQPVVKQITAAARVQAVAKEPVPARVVQIDERENYLARLLAHIDSHKFYPRSARRRGVKGDVQVSFYLNRDGTIRDLEVTGGSKLLRTAARQAIQNALSLPQPPEKMGLQEPIRFGMAYRLEG